MRALPFHDLKSLHAPLSAALEGALLATMRSGWYIGGERLRAFEAAFGAYCGGTAVGVGNGTDALELALRALGVGAGDRVVTVANAGFYASAAILNCGAEALYADVEPETLLFDVSGLDRLLSLQPKAVVVTHLYGRMAAVEEVARRCRAAGVALVEDCAQAHGARRDGRAAGSIGDVGCFSFYPTKNLGALGDAGALLCRDAALAAHIARLRQYGWGAKYEVVDAGGRNSRMDELQAAVLGVLLPLLEQGNARRRSIASHYAAGIDHPHITALPRGGEDDVVHLYVVRSPRREALRAHLSQAGIGHDVHFPVPDHRQPAMAARCASIRLPVTEQAADEVLSLPCHPALADADVERVIDACNAFPH